MSGCLEQEQEKDEGNGSNGEVNPEAPPPSDVRSKDTPQQRANNTGHAEDCANQADDGGDPVRRDDEVGNGIAAKEDAGSTTTLYSTSDDESCTVGRKSANQTAYLEPEECPDEDKFHVKVLVCLSPDGLEGPITEEKG